VWRIRRGSAPGVECTVDLGTQFCERCGRDRDSFASARNEYRDCPACGAACCADCWNLVDGACLACAPFRLVVPWKYGFKSIKSVVKVEVTDSIPGTAWNTAAPDEYGFYANVNPNVNHPRWSQATERRIGETGRRPTLMFNGYEQEVASLYDGMDLSRSF
jgi:hypothetical protein